SEGALYEVVTEQLTGGWGGHVRNDGRVNTPSVLLCKKTPIEQTSYPANRFLSCLAESPQDSTEAKVYEDDDAYDVYSVLLPHEESFEFAKGTLVIQQETASEPDNASEPCVTADAALRFKEAIADYNRVNRRQWLLQRRFHIDKPYQILSSDTILRVFN